MLRLRKLWIVMVMLGMVAVAVLAAAPVSAQAGDPEDGAVLYQQNCLVCHGQGGEGRAGASLQSVYGGIDPDVFLRETVSEGVSGTFMPAWSENYGGPLAEDQIDDIVAYIESWGTTVEPPLPLPPRPDVEIPPVPEVDGDPNAGYSVFQVNCAVCHGENAGGRVGANLTRAFAAIEPGAFAVSTISRGVDGALMPPFGQEYGGPLTEEEINNVAAYVLSIQEGSSYVPEGEQVGQVSAWPLLAVLGASVLLILALGLAVNRREAASSSDDH